MTNNVDNPIQPIPPGEILHVFLMLGILGFGGPPAHLALMEKELVERRRWIDRDYFLDMLAAINLVPGPNSTEMAIHLGYAVGGWRGMLLSGAGFILPAVISSIVLAALYTSATQIPVLQAVLLGIKPVILTLILSAAYRLGKGAITNLVMVGLLVLALAVVIPSLTPFTALIGRPPFLIPELVLLLTCGALYIIAQRRRIPSLASLWVGLPILLPVTSVPLFQSVMPTLFDYFARFFIIGGTLFGSGFVISSYIQRTFVDGLGWLTNQQLVDVLVIGQSTPGPVLSTVAAAGFVMSNNFAPGDVPLGILVAAISTAGVFLPAFLIILGLGRVVPLIRKSHTALDFLKGVNAGVIALLIGAFVNLAWATLIRPNGGVDGLSVAITGVFFILTERFRWTALRLVIAGAVIGLVRVAVLS